MSHYYFWLHSQLHPNSPAYNIPAIFTLHGPLDIPALEKSIETVLIRHEVLRATFSEQGELQNADIHDTLNFRLEQTHLDTMGNPGSLNRLLSEEVARPFDLKNGPLIRFRLIHLGTDKYVFLMVMHHCIMDLRSKELLGVQISVCYDTIIKKRNLPVLASPFQYSNHIKRQEAWSSSKPAAQMLEFWMREIKEYKGLLELPLDHPRPTVASGLGKAHFFHLPEEHSRNLHEFCRKHSIAPFVALLTCYLVLLARYCGQNKLVIGVPLSNRRHEEDKDTMGCLINILPLAFELHKDITVLQAMRQVRWKLLQAHRNQEISFHNIVAATKPPREPSYNPIFQVGFTYEPPMELKLTGLKVVSEKWHNTGSQVDIFLNIFEMSPGIRGYFEYNQDIFAPETIARMSRHYQHLVSSCHQQHEKPVNRVEIITPEERDKLVYLWNDTSVNYGGAECLQSLFEKQATNSPHAQAVVFDETVLTYQELNERANQLAHYLIKQGAGPEHIVGVFMDRSLEMVIALYGIIKAGGAYVPLETDFPKQRISFILGETKAKIILTQKHLQEKIPAGDYTSFNLDSEWSSLENYPRDNPESGSTPDNLAYVIYTSGSTGNPKGVMIEHRGLYNRLQWMQESYGLNTEDRVLQKTPFSFDVSVWELFWPLLSGATLVVAPPNAHKEPFRLCQIIKQQAITTIHFVPSMLRLFLETDESSACKTLRRVFCSGEALSWRLRENFFTRLSCELHNLYGPTEATIDASYWDCSQQLYPGKVPIGYPVANTKLYILDENLQPAPEGAIGELYIGGVQVARGYILREELNQAAFLPDPFNIPGTRMYKTGDLARYLPDGAVEYMGRVDYQVKLFGNRIELREIEEALRRHPDVDDAVVALRGEKGGKQLLAAYILSKNASLHDIRPRQYLSEILPYYMVPNDFVLLKEFPLTRSGKVDRKLLPYPDKHEDVSTSKASRKEYNYMILVRSVWKNILHTEQINDRQNFFDAGGDSLLATQVAFELERKLGVPVPLIKIFQYPTIVALSLYLKTEGYEL